MMEMTRVQKHLPSYLKRVALGKQPPSPALVLGQSETDVEPVDHDIPAHSQENEGVKDETRDRREEHLECNGCISARSRPLSITTEHEFTHDHVIHPADRRARMCYQTP